MFLAQCTFENATLGIRWRRRRVTAFGLGDLDWNRFDDDAPTGVSSRGRAGA